MSIRIAKIIIFWFALIIGSLLYSCSTESGKNEINSVDGFTYAYTVKVPDGRTVTCISWSNGGYTGGLSCDWSTAK